MLIQRLFTRLLKRSSRRPSPTRPASSPVAPHISPVKTSGNSACKILFRFYSDVLEQWTVETMWATIVDEKKGWYRLDNIPFYAQFIACDDIVFAEFDTDEQFLTFREVVTPSGNSTIQVVRMTPTIETNHIRDQFNALGCSSEKFKEGYFVMDVPASISYEVVKALLDDLFDKGTIDYAEACLSDKHGEETS